MQSNYHGSASPTHVCYWPYVALSSDYMHRLAQPAQYIGQAAYISNDPAAYSNPFFNSTPPGMFYPSLVIAILAAVVASQTMITAVFQLLSQIIKLSYFPQIKVVHTSKIFHGQIYIPWINWLLMIGTIVVTAAYSNVSLPPERLRKGFS